MWAKRRSAESPMVNATFLLSGHHCRIPARQGRSRLQSVQCNLRGDDQRQGERLARARSTGIRSGVRQTLTLSCRAAGICFDAACQHEQDVLFAISLALPITLAALSFIFLGGKSKDDENVFESPDGTVFQSPPGVQPERDKQGKLAYKAISYTPWPVEQGAEGDRLRIEVGPVGRTQNQTYVFDRLLPQPSRIFSVTLPRPMGITFEEDSRSQRLVVCNLVEGSAAHQKAQVAKMDSSQRDSTVLVGDVLRACTCTNFVYQTTALFGAKAPSRTIVLYGADNQKWTKVVNALKRGSSSDGDVTLVLERPVQ